MVVNANAIAYDTNFSNLVEKSFKFWPLKPRGTYESWLKNLCSKCKLELNQIINHWKPHDCRGSGEPSKALSNFIFQTNSM